MEEDLSSASICKLSPDPDRGLYPVVRQRFFAAPYRTFRFSRLFIQDVLRVVILTRLNCTRLVTRLHRRPPSPPYRISFRNKDLDYYFQRQHRPGPGPVFGEDPDILSYSSPLSATPPAPRYHHHHEAHNRVR